MHLSKSGNIALVKDIKSHLNPKLGLPMYSSYTQLSKVGKKTNNDINKEGFHKERQPFNNRKPFGPRWDGWDEKRDILLRLLGL